MLVLTGTLRQFGEVTLGEEKKPFLKLWVEHETPRQDGPADLKIEELLLERSAVDQDTVKSLKQGTSVSVAVRAWARGRDIAFSAVRLVTGRQNPASAS